MTMTDADRTLVFIGGLHRSGTTLVARHLAAHPDASGFADTGANEDEGQYLQSVYPAEGEYGGPGRFGFVSDAHMTETSPLVTEGNRARLWAEWGRHWHCERAVLIEKSPANMLKTRFLQAMFPTARFIMVLRHPIPNAFATQKWTGARAHELIRHWLVCNETMIRDMQYLRRATLLRYEDLMDEGSTELRRLHQFIGVSRHPDELPVRKGLNDEYLARWNMMKETIPKSLYQCLIVRCFEARVARFGYSLRDPAQMTRRDEFLAYLQAPTARGSKPQCRHRNQ
jgi:Sulfotransferase family